MRVSKLLQSLYREIGEETEILDMQEIRIAMVEGPHYGKPTPALQKYLDKIVKSSGLIVVVPEYNGSAPGILKYFIDHMVFPDSFEYRPVCFVGLGGMFGGLRPVEHLQQVFGYRNAFIFPERIFLINVFKEMSADGQLNNPVAMDLLRKQTKGFTAFVKALENAELNANSHLARKVKKT